MQNKTITFSCDSPITPSFFSHRNFYESSEEIATLQEELTGRLVGLARGLYADEAFADTHKEMIGGLFATIPTEPFLPEFLVNMLEQVKAAKLLLTPHCAMCGACSRTHDYDMKSMLENDTDTRSFKNLILFGLKGLAYYSYRAMALGEEDQEIIDFFYRGMFSIGEDWTSDEYLPILQDLARLSYKCLSMIKVVYEKKQKPLPLDETKTTLCWYDAKDIFLFFAWLHSGEKNFHFCLESLPAYLSKNVFSQLCEQYRI